MKITINYFGRMLCAFMMCAITFTSCLGGGEKTEPDATLEVSQDVVEIGYEAEECSVYVTSSCSWTAQVPDDWITLEVEKGESGTKELKFNVQENPETGDRHARIVVIGEGTHSECVIDVIQAAFEPKVNFSQSEINAESRGGIYEIEIKSNCEYEVSENSEWLSVETTSGGLKVTVDQSDLLIERVAEINLWGKAYAIEEKLIVKQDGWTMTDDNVIYYTGKLKSSEGESLFNPVIPEVNIVHHSYEDGQGIIVCDGPITIVWGFSYTQLTSITVPESVIEIAGSAFAKCVNLKDFTIPKNVISIGEHAFYGCTSLTKAVFPEGLLSIGKSAYECSALEDIIIPDSVTELGERAFLDCNNAKTVVIGDGITDEDLRNKSVFTNVRPTSLVLGDGIVEVIPSYLCSSLDLRTLTIGSNVNIIYPGIGGKALQTVFCKPLTQPRIYVSKTGSSTFPFNTGLKIYVPRESYGFYATGGVQSDILFNDQFDTVNWRRYKDYIEPYDFQD